MAHIILAHTVADDRLEEARGFRRGRGANIGGAASRGPFLPTLAVRRRFGVCAGARLHRVNRSALAMRKWSPAMNRSPGAWGRVRRALALAAAPWWLACSSTSAEPPRDPVKVRVERPAISGAAPRPSDLESTELPSSCGALELERVALVASGKGERHPAMVRIDGAHRACVDDADADRRACAAVRWRVLEDKAAGYGAQHPRVLAANAQWSFCVAWESAAGLDAPPPPRPTSRDCARWRAEQAELRAKGKGEHHPDVLVVEAKLAMCS